MNVSTHSRTKAAALMISCCLLIKCVSTHSRTKAAALHGLVATHTPQSFNTQPHEGGCN